MLTDQHSHTIVEAFAVQAASVDSVVHRVASADAAGRALDIVCDRGCRTVALADVVPAREDFIAVFPEGGLVEIAARALRPTADSWDEAVAGHPLNVGDVECAPTRVIRGRSRTGEASHGTYWHRCPHEGNADLHPDGGGGPCAS
jgi:hypothetical protein